MQVDSLSSLADEILRSFLPQGFLSNGHLMTDGNPDFTTLRIIMRPEPMKINGKQRLPRSTLAEDAGIPYQTLINLYLRDCAVHQRKLRMKWAT